MKKTALLVTALALTAGAAYAAPMTIVGSPHDMSNGTGEICIYCHTPHNAAIPIPLWNRVNPSAGEFTLYKTSATLTAATKASKLSDDSISLFCMSCHDGSIALSAVVNANDDANNAEPTAVNSKFGTSALSPTNPKNLKRDLSNTHPVGFDYTAVVAEDSGIWGVDTVMTTFGTKAGGKTTAQNFLYGAEGKTFECASCHRVHDPGPSSNFLRIENEDSALCLACHNK